MKLDFSTVTESWLDFSFLILDIISFILVAHEIFSFVAHEKFFTIPLRVIRYKFEFHYSPLPVRLVVNRQGALLHRNVTGA